MSFYRDTSIPIEARIALDKFKPRDYQLPFLDAFENKGYKKLLLMWARRGGKDVTCWNAVIRHALRNVGNYFYCFPEASHGRRALWESITNDGRRFIDFIPQKLIKKINNVEMKIELYNNSTINIVGVRNPDRIVGSNCRGVVLSECAVGDQRTVYQLILPIINANGGFIIVNSTPRSRNFFFELYEIASHSKSWFCQKLTVEDMGHIPLEVLEQDVKSGEMSYELYRREYYCEFSSDEGLIFAKYVDDLYGAGQITNIPWEADFLVETAWDIGTTNDSTAIIFFQKIGGMVRIIDFYQNNHQGCEHYVNYIKSKPYVYGSHWGPHDLMVHDHGTNISRLHKYKQLGIVFETRTNKRGLISSALRATPLADSIENVRSAINKVWIDENKGEYVIKALSNYARQKDPSGMYYDRPRKSHYNHAVDAFRYMCESLTFDKVQRTPEEVEREYYEAAYGSSVSRRTPFGNNFYS